MAVRKRTRNTSKRAKLNSQGFKVHKNFKLYIGKATEGGWSRGGKPAVRKELVTMVNKFWNDDPCIRKIEKHIKGLTMVYNTNNTFAGRWDYETKTVRIMDNGRDSIQFYKSVLIHEVNGHAFWDLSRKWRRVELIAFNELANKLSPITPYIRDYTEKHQWKKMNDDNDDEIQFKKSIEHIPDWDANEELTKEYQEKYDAFKEKRKTNGHDTMTRYANEQHSAITEIVYGNNGHDTILDKEAVKQLTKLWELLQY